MKKIKMSAVAAVAVASLFLAGCNEDSTPTVTPEQSGTTSGTNGPLVQNGIVIDSGFKEKDERNPAIPSELIIKKDFVANKDIAALGEFNLWDFSQVIVFGDREAMLLNDGDLYSGFGVRLINPPTPAIQTDDWSRIEAQSESFIKQLKSGIEDQYTDAEINTLAFQRTRNAQSAVLRVTLDVDIGNEALTSSNLLRLNMMANTLNNGYQPHFYPLPEYANDGNMRVDLVFWHDNDNVYSWVSAYPQKYSDSVNVRYKDFITGEALVSANPVLSH